jgi:hypothetical protein
VALTYEDYADPLSARIAGQQLQGRPFTEPEIWKVIFQLASACKDYEMVGRLAGNMHPDSVLFNKSRQSKVVTRHSWPGMPIGTQQVLEASKGCYLCPALTSAQTADRTRPQAHLLGLL